MGKRIISLQEAQSITNDDYLVIDNQSGGTKKVSAGFINDIVSDVEVDGTSVVNNGVAEIDLSGKQDTIVAGSNITIAADGKTISATDTTYTAGTNVQINNGVISATDTTYTAGTNVQIESGVISATDTTYTAGTNVQIDNGVISATDTTYTAGTNVDITNGVISATDTTYTAGTGIDITNGVISSNITPGSTVTITPALATGTKVADYSINGVSGELYAPSGGGSNVSVTQKTSTGTNIADITVDGVTTQLFAPNGGGGASAVSDLTDVNLTSLANGQILKYDSTSQKWINSDESGGGSGTYTSTLLNDGTAVQDVLTLSSDYTNFDELLITWMYDNNLYITTLKLNTSDISINDTITLDDYQTRDMVLTVTSTTAFTITSQASGMGILSIRGLTYSKTAKEKSRDVLWTTGSWTMAHPITDYDEIIFKWGSTHSTCFIPSDIMTYESFIVIDPDTNNFMWFDVTDASTFTVHQNNNLTITSIDGVVYTKDEPVVLAEEMTLDEYNALPSAQRNDGTIRFIPNGSTIADTSAIDMSSISSRKEYSMDVSSTSDQVIISWLGGNQIGATFYYATPIDVTTWDKITFDLTTSSCYGGGSTAQQARWNVQIGLQSEIPSSVQVIDASDSRWIAVKDYANSNTTYDDQEIDVSELTGSYYLVINAHGWNAIIDDFTLEKIGAIYPSQIKYMSKTYGIGDISEGKIDTLWEGTVYPASQAETVTLDHPYDEYDFLIVNSYALYDSVYFYHSDIFYDLEMNGSNLGALNSEINLCVDLKPLSTTSIQMPYYGGEGQNTRITGIYGVKLGGNGGSSTDVTELTQSEYNALPEEEKNNGCIYMVSSQASTPEELTEAQTNTSTAVTASSYTYDTNFNQYHYPWCAFNRVSPNPNEMAYPTPGVTTQTCWSPNASQDGSNSWICYHFDRAYKMTSMTINSFTDYSSSATKSMVIEGSNDGTTWTNILLTGNSFSLNSDLHTLTPNNVNLNSDTAYEYVRLRSLEPMGASYQPSVFIDEIFVYGYNSEKALKKIYYMGTEYGNTGGSSEITYSTTEHQVGTWIDGSDLYEKTISISNVSLSSGSYETVDTITGLDTIISCNGYVVEGNLKYTLNDITLRVIQDGTSVKMYSPSGTTWTISSGAIIIRYTKVTS